MKRISTSLLFISILILSSQAQTLGEKVQKLLEEYPSISVSAYENGEFYDSIFTTAPKIHNNKEKYYLYSISKSLTGLAIAKLYEEEKIDIDQSIKLYLKDLPDYYEDIKISHLLTHTSGIRNYEKNEWLKFSQNHCSSAKDAVNWFASDALISNPGQEYQYSTFNYVVLSYLIEHVTGKSFIDYINELTKGIADILFYLDDENTLDGEVPYYENWSSKKGKGKLIPAIDNSCKLGGGGIVASATDVVKLHAAILNGEILKNPNEYYQPLSEVNSYAYGTSRGKTGELNYNAHTASGMGASGAIMIFPDQKKVVMVIGNVESDDIKENIYSISKDGLQ
ncbi:MAG: serine hydrolase domain-containing protein [Ekhidna sp.]|uniref:serine hydrolase domain-containing protein n=1 Tax=Ekhidna sp. TaxID=2608089 RepID=UPI0032EDB835